MDSWHSIKVLKDRKERKKQQHTQPNLVGALAPEKHIKVTKRANVTYTQTSGIRLAWKGNILMKLRCLRCVKIKGVLIRNQLSPYVLVKFVLWCGPSLELSLVFLIVYILCIVVLFSRSKKRRTITAEYKATHEIIQKDNKSNTNT